MLKTIIIKLAIILLSIQFINNKQTTILKNNGLRLLINTNVTNETDIYNPDLILEDCNSNICPIERGICDRTNRCICLHGFTTLRSKIYCNYKQKKLVIAFLLEFLLSFGLGHLYIEKYILGGVKFLYCVFCIFLLCGVGGLKKAIITPYVQTLFILIFCFWQIIDTIFMASGYYLDGNEIKLKDW